MQVALVTLEVILNFPMRFSSLFLNINFLQRIYKSPNIEVLDAFEKLREQAQVSHEQTRFMIFYVHFFIFILFLVLFGTAERLSSWSQHHQFHQFGLLQKSGKSGVFSTQRRFFGSFDCKKKFFFFFFFL